MLCHKKLGRSSRRCWFAAFRVRAQVGSLKIPRHPLRYSSQGDAAVAMMKAWKGLVFNLQVTSVCRTNVLSGKK